MAQLPQEQKAKIAEQVPFQEEKSKLDAEVSKWMTAEMTSSFCQANVHDHDGDDRLHQVSSNCPPPCSNACQRPHKHTYTSLLDSTQ